MWRYKLKPLAKGMVKSLPGIEKVLHKRPGSTMKSRYCYAVWMRHLVNTMGNGANKHPISVVELGPGGTVGVGMAALLSGAEKYTGLDVVNNWENERNLQVFDELVEMFRKRESIPGKDEFPKMHAPLPSYDFPSQILPDKWLEKALFEERVSRIRKDIETCMDKGGEGEMVRYLVPWERSNNIQPGSIDLIWSQAVLEHVEDPRNVYESMYKWLGKDGIISHEIDFKSHATSGLWNGHWSYSDFQWKVVKGRREYLINRLTYKAHLDLMKEVGFHVIQTVPTKMESKLQRKHLAKRYKDMTDEELTTPTMFFQAKKEQHS